MFAFTIKKTPAVFSKFFAVADREAILGTVPTETRRVVFIDTPSTQHLVDTIGELVSRGIEVVVRDHHDVPNPRNPREQEIADAAARIRELVGSNATISDRATHPACSTLIDVGEFAGEGTVIVADPDPDGLTAAMKAVGVVYDGLDADAAVLDGARSEQTADRLTPVALLLVKGMATLPPFNPERPQVSEEAKSKLFAEFAAAAGGDATALESLGRKVEAYEAAVGVARRFGVGEGRFGIPGVVGADTVGAGQYDLATLAERMESCEGCRITVVRKDSGPIAAKHNGVQYSMAVISDYQSEIDLRELLPAKFTSSPEAGIISNTSFLLHVSEKVWKKKILPALRRRIPGRRVVMETHSITPAGTDGPLFGCEVSVSHAVLGIFDAKDHAKVEKLLREDSSRVVFYFEG